MRWHGWTELDRAINRIEKNFVTREEVENGMYQTSFVDYKPICERRGEEKDREDNPLLPDDASYTPLLERMDSRD